MNIEIGAKQYLHLYFQMYFSTCSDSNELVVTKAAGKSSIGDYPKEPTMLVHYYLYYGHTHKL